MNAPTPADLLFLNRLFMHLPRVTRKKENSWDPYEDVSSEPRCSAVEASIMTSELLHSPGLHAPVLDIDLPAALVPSSTPGHYHLVIERAMTWRTYKRLLRAMTRAGLLEKGFTKMAIRRGYTSVRVPWVKKDINGE
jgi:hypothetical protein